MAMPSISTVLVTAVLAASTSLVSTVAHADACAGASGFDDVAQAASCCSDTQWMKNRAITAGCTASTYCPDANLTRAQMALFMHRLGVALAPAIDHRQSGASGASINTGTGVSLCPPPSPIAAANYPRQATVSGFVFATNASAAMTLKTGAVAGLNGTAYAVLGQYALLT